MSGQVVQIRDGVLLTGRAVDVALYAVETAMRFRHFKELPPLHSLEVLRSSLSPAGHADSDEVPEEQGWNRDEVTSEQAADLLGCSVRTARRLAPALGGRLVGGRWLLDHQAVLEHLQGKEIR